MRGRIASTRQTLMTEAVSALFTMNLEGGEPGDVNSAALAVDCELTRRVLASSGARTEGSWH